MKKFVVIVLVNLFFMQLHAQLVIKDGAELTVQKGVELTVDTDIENDSEILNDGTLFVAGNWDNKNQLGGFLKKSIGLIVLEGASQELTGMFPLFFPSIKLEGTKVKSLKQKTEIGSNLDLGDRELSIEGNKLILLNASENALNRKDGFISSSEQGFFYRKLGPAGNYLYPMGAIDKGQLLYRPIEINSSSNEENTVGVSFLNKDPNTVYYYRDSKKENIREVNSKYYHVLNRTVGNSSLNINYFYHDSEEYTSLAGWINNFWENIPSSKPSTVVGQDLNIQITFSPDKIENLPVTLASLTESHNLVFYNSYSPDGDGKNDTWTIGNIDDYPDNEITVFNRWGGEIFRTKSFSSVNRWDGSSLNDGTYYYLLKVKIGTEYKVFKGFISLVKNQK